MSVFIKYKLHSIQTMITISIFNKNMKKSKLVPMSEKNKKVFVSEVKEENCSV